MKSIKEYLFGKKEETPEDKPKENQMNLANRTKQIKDVMSKKRKMLEELDK